MNALAFCDLTITVVFRQAYLLELAAVLLDSAGTNPECHGHPAPSPPEVKRHL